MARETDTKTQEGGQMEFKNFPFYRRVMKARKFAEVPHCQATFCTKPPTELHEIISCAESEGNKAAQRLSFVPELTVALCSYHYTLARTTNFNGKTAFLQANIDLYGYARVAAAYERLMLALGKQGYDLILQPDGQVFDIHKKIEIPPEILKKIEEYQAEYPKRAVEEYAVYRTLCQKYGLQPRYSPMVHIPIPMDDLKRFIEQTVDERLARLLGEPETADRLAEGREITWDDILAAVERHR